MQQYNTMLQIQTTDDLGLTNQITTWSDCDAMKRFRLAI